MRSEAVSATAMSRRSFLMVGTGAASAALLGGCVGGGDDGQGRILRLGATSGPVSLDPYLQNLDPVNLWYLQLAYDPLIRLDPETAEERPALATAWEYADSEHTRFQLQIREGVEFHDGTKLDAQAVVGSLQYALEAGVNKNWLDTVDRVRALGSDTVEVVLGSRNDALPVLLSQRLLLGSVVSPAGVEEPSKLLNRTYGAGPYILDQERTVSNDTYVYTRNENYWNPDDVHWDAVEIKVVANSAAALQGVRIGSLDLVRADSITAVAADQAELGIAQAPFAIYGINFLDREGTIAPALADVRVRQALSCAIDRDGIAHAVYGRFAEPNATLTLPDFLGYSEEDARAIPYDPGRARSLLAEAGYGEGLRLQMATTTLGDAQRMAQAVVENWRQVGVRVDLITYEDEGQMVSEVTAGTYPMAVYSYGALPLFIQAKSFFTGGRTQFNAFDSKDSKLDEYLKAAVDAEDDEERGRQYALMLRRATVDLAWMANVFAASFPMAYSEERVRDVKVSGMNPSPDVATTVAPVDPR